MQKALKATAAWSLLLEHILSVLSALAGAGEWRAILSLSWAVLEYLDRQGRWQARLAVCQGALHAARSLPDQGQESAWLTYLGLAYADPGDPRRAIEYYEQALSIDREIGNRRGEGIHQGNLGIAYRQQFNVRRSMFGRTGTISVPACAVAVPASATQTSAPQPTSATTPAPNHWNGVPNGC